MVYGRNQVKGEADDAEAGGVRCGPMAETKTTKTTKTLTASELSAKLVRVVGRHSAISKRAGELAARHFAASEPQGTKQ